MSVTLQILTQGSVMTVFAQTTARCVFCIIALFLPWLLHLLLLALQFRVVQMMLWWTWLPMKVSIAELVQALHQWCDTHVLYSSMNLLRAATHGIISVVQQSSFREFICPGVYLREEKAMEHASSLTENQSHSIAIPCTFHCGWHTH